jgi:hypothetical protein
VFPEEIRQYFYSGSREHQQLKFSSISIVGVPLPVLLEVTYKLRETPTMAHPQMERRKYVVAYLEMVFYDIPLREYLTSKRGAAGTQKK